MEGVSAFRGVCGWDSSSGEHGAEECPSPTQSNMRSFVKKQQKKKVGELQNYPLGPLMEFSTKVRVCWTQCGQLIQHPTPAPQLTNINLVN